MTTYYHPASENIYQHYLRHGFLSISSLNALRFEQMRHTQKYTTDYECRTLVCSSAEDALEYGEAYYGATIDLKIIAIEGDYPSYPITGTMVPEGTVMLLGEIPADKVSLVEPPKPSVEIAMSKIGYRSLEPLREKSLASRIFK
jgi:hypothetical protein